MCDSQNWSNGTVSLIMKKLKLVRADVGLAGHRKLNIKVLCSVEHLVGMDTLICHLSQCNCTVYMN